MNAIKIIKVKEDSPEWMKSLQGRYLIKIQRHRVIVPDWSNKRLYLGKRRCRELLANATELDRELEYEKLSVYKHAPKAFKEHIQSLPKKVISKQPQKQEVIQEVKKSFWKRLFS